MPREPRASGGSPLHTAWRLYAHPARLAAALGKAYAVAKDGGVAALGRALRGKLGQPQMPVRLLVDESEAAANLTYEDRWVLSGHGLSSEHSVSVIIPTKGNGERLGACLAGVERSTLPEARLDIVVINNGPELRSLPPLPWPVRVLTETRRFNWAAYNNRAVRGCPGDYLLFLNDDVLPLHGGWLDALLAECVGTVGAVGAKLLYPSGRIQHVGIALNAGPEGGHAFKFESRDFAGPRGELRAPREVDAVTGACLLTPHAVFEAIGGFDERFAENFNDVDYCLRLRKSGYSVIVTPKAELIHFETLTRPPRVLRAEHHAFHNRWIPGP